MGVHEAVAGIGHPPQQPVDRCGLQLFERTGDIGRQFGDGIGQRLLHPHSSLPRGCGEGDEGRRRQRAPQHAEQSGEGVGLACARATGDNGHPGESRHHGSRRLVEVGVVAQQFGSRRCEGCGGDRCRWTSEACHEFRGNDGLLLPVPLEVQPLAHEAERAIATAVRTDGDQGAGDDRCEPRVMLRHHLGGDADTLLVGVEPHLVDRRQLEAGRPGTERPDGHRQCQQDALVGFPEQVRHLLGDMDVTPRQGAGGMDVEEQAGGEARGEVGHRSLRSASRSDSSVTRPAGGNQLNTPLPSTAVGPPMPRTNR